MGSNPPTSRIHVDCSPHITNSWFHTIQQQADLGLHEWFARKVLRWFSSLSINNVTDSAKWILGIQPAEVGDAQVNAHVTFLNAGEMPRWVKIAPCKYTSSQNPFDSRRIYFHHAVTQMQNVFNFNSSRTRQFTSSHRRKWIVYLRAHCLYTPKLKNFGFSLNVYNYRIEQFYTIIHNTKQRTSTRQHNSSAPTVQHQLPTPTISINEHSHH